MAIQRGLARVEYWRNWNGYTHEPRAGNEKALWHFYTPVAKRHGTLSGQRCKRVLAAGRRTQPRHRKIVREIGLNPLCRHGSLCTLAFLAVTSSGNKELAAVASHTSAATTVAALIKNQNLQSIHSVSAGGTDFFLNQWQFHFAPNPFSIIFAAHSKKGPVAQLNRAFDYGSKGFRFESWRGHKKSFTFVKLFLLI
mgnify:CR=1 FL=1